MYFRLTYYIYSNTYLKITMPKPFLGKKQNIPGTVKYVGPVYHSNFNSGIYAGLKLDIPGKQFEDNYVFVKGSVSPPERCDFTSSQQYNNSVLWSLFIMFSDQKSNYFSKFIHVEDSVLITETLVV